MPQTFTIASDLFVRNEPQETPGTPALWEYYVFCICRYGVSRKSRWCVFLKCISGKTNEIAARKLKRFYESPYTIIVGEDQFDTYREAIRQLRRTRVIPKRRSKMSGAAILSTAG